MEQGGIDWANQGMSLAIAVVAPILTTLLLSYAKPVRDLLRFRFARYKEQVDADALAIVRTHRLSKQPDWEFYKGMAGSFAWTIVILLMGTASIFAVTDLLSGADAGAAGGSFTAFRSGPLRLVALAFFSFVGAMTIVSVLLSIHVHARALWIFARQDQFTRELGGETPPIAIKTKRRGKTPPSASA
jgi:hypothetical protein